MAKYKRVEKKQKPGPQPKTLTDEQMKQVEAMAGYGLSVPQIAHCIGFAVRTFEKRVEEDEELKECLERGRAKAFVQVAQACFRMASSGKKEHQAATFFWLKTRGGWRETNRLEHTGEDGKPIEGKFKLVIEDYRGNPNTPDRKTD
jgi:hypothetical protein